MNKWGEFLMKTPTKIVVVFVACGLLAAGIYGTLNITQKFEWKKTSPDGSYFRKYVKICCLFFVFSGSLNKIFIHLIICVMFKTTKKKACLYNDQVHLFL